MKIQNQYNNRKQIVKNIINSLFLFAALVIAFSAQSQVCEDLYEKHKTEIDAGNYDGYFADESNLGCSNGTLIEGKGATFGYIQKKGFVAGIGYVTDENGNRLFVEYAADGKLAPGSREIAVRQVYEDSQIVSAYLYQQTREIYNNLTTQYPQSVLMDRQSYESNYTTPNLKTSTRSVLVNQPNSQFGSNTNPIIHEFAIFDLKNNPTSLMANALSLIVDKQGRIQHQSIYSFGYKVDYIDPVAGDEGTVYLNPISGVPIEDATTPSLGSTGMSDSSGQFFATAFVPPCMFFPVDYTILMMGKVPFENFNAKGEKFPAYYPVIGRTGHFCIDGRALTSMLSANNPAMGAAVQSIFDSMAVPIYQDMRLLVSMLKLDGLASFPSNVTIAADQNTKYQFNAPLLDNSAYSNIDINADGQADTVITDPATGEQKIYFNNPINDPNATPDVTRVVDTHADFNHQGLLSEITINDLVNTDIYIFRLATGQLINVTEGLQQGIASDLSNESFYFGANSETPVIRYSEVLFSGFDGNSRSSQTTSSGNVSDSTTENYVSKPWEQSTLADPARFHQNEPTFVTRGEQVKVIVINRASGYTGSTIATLDGNGRINSYAKPISLQPPNLKVKVERKHIVASGLRHNEERINTITFEGAGLSSDQYVKITTEWYDHDGTPLIPGGSQLVDNIATLPSTDSLSYTGRLAVIDSPGVLRTASQSGGSSGLALFSIEPGIHTQLIRLPGADLQKQHYYVHINGEPKNRLPDFSTIGAGNGPLATRPAHYVPFQVSMLDEQASIDQQLAFNQNLTTNKEPVYRWVYRPEMQFTLFDLDIEQQLITVIDTQLNLVTSTLQVDYEITEPTYSSLELFGPETELVFGLGAQEYLAATSVADTLLFDDVQKLENLDPANYLTLSLYTNSDPYNMLYEFTIPTLKQDNNTANLIREYSLGAFSDGNLSLSQITDSYQKFTFAISDESRVYLNLLDDQKNPVKVLVPETTLQRGTYRYVVTYDDIASAGILPRSTDDFYLELVAVTEDGSANGFVQKITAPGNINEYHDGRNLGQVIQHDVLIQDGSLSVQQQDIVLPGLGPQLSLSRSYSNKSSNAGIMGAGWNHNYDITLSKRAYGSSSGQYNIPTEVETRRGRFFTENIEPALLSQVTISNGGMFKRDSSGAWIPQLGNHGTLTETGAGYDFRSKDGTLYHFTKTAHRQLVANYIEDRNGNRTTLAYDLEYDSGRGYQQRLDQVTDALGRSLTFNYTGSAQYGTRLTTISGPDNIGMTYEYDDNGQLSKAFRTDKPTYQYSFSYVKDNKQASWNLNKISDPNTQSITYDYATATDYPGLASVIPGMNAEDIVKQVNYADNTSHSFDYAVSPNQRTITDARGNTTTYTLNHHGNPVKIEEPLGKTTLMSWSIDDPNVGDNVMISKTDALGHLWSYEYDAKGNITKETDPKGLDTTSTWHQQFAQLISRTDRNNNTIRNTYDLKGNLIREQDAEGYITEHDYNSLGLRVTTRDARPAKYPTTYTYDANGFPAMISQAEGSVTQFEYDFRGRLLSKTSPNNHTTSYEYDTLDRLTKQIDPDGAVMQFSYDAKGNKLSETSRLGLKLEYDYDQRDRVVTTTRSATDLGTATKIYHYDQNGNLLSETDWKGVATSYVYDALNRLDSIKNRDNQTMSYEYDLVGNKTAEVDYNGHRIDYIYDELNRLTQTTYVKADGNIVTSQSYDNENNVITQIDGELKTTTYGYDRRYLKTSATNALSSVYQWTYDPVGNLVTEANENTARTEYDYDGQNRRVAMRRFHTPAESYQTLFAYDANGNLIRETDPRSNVQTSSYDALNRLLTQTDFDNTSTTNYEYLQAGRLTHVTDARQITRSTTIDSLQRAVRYRAGDGGTNITEYDANNNVIRVTDARNNVTETVYDVLDRATTIHQAVGSTAARSLQKTYDKVGNVLTETDARNTVTQYSYDELNRRTSQTDDVGGFNLTQSWTYNNVGKVLTHTNARNKTTVSTYDNLHRLKTVSDPLTQVVEYSYDAVGNVLTEKDKRNTITTHSYDDLNRLTQSSKAGVTLLRKTYDGNNNVTSVFDANNNETKTSYTARNQVDVITYDDANTQTHSYDEVGNLLTVTDEAGQTTTYSYDSENRQASSSNFNSETTAYEYDKNGNRTTVRKPNGNSWVNNYDALNRLSSVSDPLNYTTAYEYDDNSNLTAQIDAAGKRVDYVYDKLNRKTKHNQPGLLTTSFQYDENGNLTQLTDAKGQVVTYTYDDIDREITRTYLTGSSAYLNISSISTVYDASNNISSITEVKTGAAGINDVTSMTYDLLDRMLSSTQRGLSITYTYDDNGNRTSVATASNSTTYTFDNRNRLETAVAGANTTSYTYYPDGKLDFILFPNGTRSTYAYDNADRITSLINESLLTSTTLSQFAYQYDSHGNRTSMTETQAASTDTTDYEYDNSDRLTNFTLTRADGSVQTTAYTLDAVSNRLTETVTDNAVTMTDRSYSYDDKHWLSQITDNLAAQTINYSYDKNGNTVQKVDNTQATPLSTVFNYDVRDQLAEVKSGPVGAETNLLGQYDYNYNGMRVRHRSSDRGDIDYYYDGQSIIEERTPANALIAHYRYADRLLSLENGSSSQYYHHDALGSTTNLSDSAGNTQVSYKLDPWGHIREQQGSSENRQIFTGQEHDSNTGLIYFGARYYDPDVARFITQDSYLGEPGTPPSLHRYLYAFGNPLSYWDPTGHASVSTNIEQAADGCGAITCGIYATGYALYHTFTLGFASYHDPIRDAYEEGAVSEEDYYIKGIGGGLAIAGASLATARLGHVAMAGKSTLAGKVATSALIEGTAAGSLTYAEQKTHQSLGIREDVNLADVVTSSLTGAALASAKTVDVIGKSKAQQRAQITKEVSSLKSIAQNQSDVSAKIRNIRINQRAKFKEGNTPLQKANRDLKAALDRFKVRESGGVGSKQPNTLIDKVPNPNPISGAGYGVNNPPVRIKGEWSRQDYFNALNGRTPKGLGKPDLHHANQMPGSGIHEIIPSQHRGNKALHSQPNQGVTAEMRKADKELHWWYRAREQGADKLFPDWIYD